MINIQLNYLGLKNDNFSIENFFEIVRALLKNKDR